MKFIESIYEKARQSRGRVAVPECTNELMMRACVQAVADGLAHVVFVGDPAEIRAQADRLSLDLGDICIQDSHDQVYQAKLVQRYDALPNKILGRKTVAKRMAKAPMYLAMVMEAVGDAECTFGGLDTATYDFVMAASGIIGQQEGVASPSGLLLMEIDNFEGSQGNFFGMADGAVNTEPSAEQLAGIATASCDTYQKLTGIRPRAAFLSYSTDGSGDSPSVERVREGLRLACQARPDLNLDGEFQADAAIVPRVAAKKVRRESTVAGQANVLIYPDAAACNIATKLIQQFSPGRSYGPVYQGFRLPVLDCSRGDTEERLYDNLCICSVLAAR